MMVYDINGNAILKPGISLEAVHEEELMKSDFVRLSWSDAERYVIKAGTYITPYLDNKNHQGDPMRYMLFRDYVPEQIRPGEYSYKPEFQHPKMWLGYVPFLFATYDAANQPVKKTEYEYIGPLGTLLEEICGYINNALADAGFIGEHDDRFSVYLVGEVIDANETVTVSFANDDILSAIARVCEVTGYEYHLEWIEMESGGQRHDQKLLYFGSVYLGGEVEGEDDEYELEIGRNIGVPKVTESKEKQYNRFYIQGGSRNNAMATEHGNVSLNTRLTLVGYTNPGDPTAEPPIAPHYYAESIIDTRPAAEQNSPGLTGIITLDDVYPHLELYLYDLHERHKYKTDDNGNVTTEPWSVWYFKLAYLSDLDAGSIGTATVGGVTKYWHDFPLKSDPKTAVTAAAQSQDDPVVGIDLPLEDIGLPVKKNLEREQRYATVRKKSNDTTTTCKVGVRSGLDSLELEEYIDDEGEHQNSKAFLNGLTVNDDLEILDDIDLDSLPYGNFVHGTDASGKLIVTTHAIDGLAPMLGFMYNSSGANSNNANANALGTREFEIVFHSKAVTFDAKDDVEGQTGIGAGYYEIIHTTEGSDGLIMPTTSTQGIVPYGTQAPSTANSKAQIFNVVLDDPQGAFREMAQAELELQAKAEIVRTIADQNHYTAPANPVAFETGKPRDIRIGHKVVFDDGQDPEAADRTIHRIKSRIIKLVTKLDYDFDVEVTFGNTLMKRFSDRIMAQIAKLGSGTGGYESIDITPEAQRAVHVEYSQWIRGGSYFFETVNKKTGVLEISDVWHRNCLWTCRRTLTTDEPWFTSRDWECVRVTEITLKTTATKRLVKRRILNDGMATVATLGFVLKVGNYDATSEITQSQAVWTRQSKGWETDQVLANEDEVWNRSHQNGNLTLSLRVSDLPSNFATAGEAQYTVTVKNSWVNDSARITI